MSRSVKDANTCYQTGQGGIRLRQKKLPHIHPIGAPSLSLICYFFYGPKLSEILNLIYLYNTKLLLAIKYCSNLRRNTNQRNNL